MYLLRARNIYTAFMSTVKKNKKRKYMCSIFCLLKYVTYLNERHVLPSGSECIIELYKLCILSMLTNALQRSKKLFCVPQVVLK